MDLGTILDCSTQTVLMALNDTGVLADYYLAGGTGLALQLGHRRSLDLDFFQNSVAERLPLSRLLDQVDGVFSGSRAKLTLKQTDQVSWDINGTKVTFLAYPFRPLWPLVPAGSLFPELHGLSLAAPRDIASMKAYALGRRSTFRDYIDLCFLLMHGLVTLGGIIEDATRKFVIGGEAVFSTKLFLEQLTYTEDVEDKDASIRMVIGGNLTASHVETLLKKQVQEFIDDETAPTCNTGNPRPRKTNED